MFASGWLGSSRQTPHDYIQGVTEAILQHLRCSYLSNLIRAALAWNLLYTQAYTEGPMKPTSVTTITTGNPAMIRDSATLLRLIDLI